MSRFPNIWQAILLVAALSVCDGVLGGALGFTLGIAGVSAPLWVQLLPVKLVSTGLVLALGTRFSGLRLSQVLALRPVSALIWIPISVLVVGLTIVLSEIDNATRYFLPMPIWLLELFIRISQESWLGGFVLLAMLAPITEEPVFRGLILRGFLARYSAPVALFGSALLFGLAHANPWQLASGLIVGLLLGWLYYRTGSLWPCLFTHALFNGLPHVVAPLLPPIQGFTTDPRLPVQFQPLWLDMAGLAFTLVGFVLLLGVLGGQRGASSEASASL